MSATPPSPKRYLTDEKGSRIAVVLDIETYQAILDELQSIRAYDEAKASGDERIPFK